MSKRIRIGTRDSKLALWQASLVQELLTAKGYEPELVFIKSEGDINLITPLYELGVQGIFTKALDTALLENKIDMAVHSYKDIPTLPAKGLDVLAVLKRGNPFDTFVSKQPLHKEQSTFVIATSSIRRKAQWLCRYPGSAVHNLRGNVQTRLQKLKNADWDGAIFAAAGLERLELTELATGPQTILDWMLPAPAQGAIAIVGRIDDEEIAEACTPLNDEITRICTKAERDFLRALQGGCSTPISAYVFVKGQHLLFKGNITAVDGSESIDIDMEVLVTDFALLGKKAADAIIAKGAGKYIKH